MLRTGLMARCGNGAVRQRRGVQRRASSGRCSGDPAAAVRCRRAGCYGGGCGGEPAAAGAVRRQQGLRAAAVRGQRRCGAPAAAVTAGHGEQRREAAVNGSAPAAAVRGGSRGATTAVRWSGCDSGEPAATWRLAAVRVGARGELQHAGEAAAVRGGAAAAAVVRRDAAGCGGAAAAAVVRRAAADGNRLLRARDPSEQGESASEVMASSKLAALRNALKPAFLPRGAIRGLPARSFSTGEQDSSSSNGPFINPPQEGLVFGRLTNTGRNALKSDIIHYLEGCDLNVDDLKVKYNQFYNPVGMLLQFPSRPSFETAIRQITRKGRLYSLARIDRTEWDLQINYDGKTVLLRPPRNAAVEDIERLFSGCNYDASGTELVFKQTPAGPPIKLALVRFPTRSEAMTAVRLRNKSFCLNNPTVMHVLQ